MDNINNLIPTIKLDEVSEFGVQVVNYSKIEDTHFVKKPHRDEDYLFVLVRAGYLKLMVDFREIIIPERSVYYILPGQVHQHLDSDIDVYVVAMDALLINQTYKFVLDGGCFAQVPVLVSPEKTDRLITAIRLLAAEVGDTAFNICREHIKRGFIDAVAGMFTEGYFGYGGSGGKRDPSAVRITAEFKKLLFADYKKLKKPSSYAASLNVSTPYLNEAVKETSGQTVSYWIQHMIMIEAKRLLFYTDKTIKVIAYELGYTDHAYFSRMFAKIVRIPAMAFREKYR